MKRELPIVDIAGTPFYADAITETFTEVADPTNEISVMEMMNFDDHHEFIFNKTIKKLAENYSPDNETVWLRPIAATDYQGMEIMLKDGVVNWVEHYQSKLPVIDIAGTRFYVDEVRKAFREVDNRWNRIGFSDVIQGQPCHIYFDTKVKNVPFPHEFDPQHLPPHIQKVKVPSGYELTKMLQLVKKLSPGPKKRKGMRI